MAGVPISTPERRYPLFGGSNFSSVRSNFSSVVSTPEQRYPLFREYGINYVATRGGMFQRLNGGGPISDGRFFRPSCWGSFNS